MKKNGITQYVEPFLLANGFKKYKDDCFETEICSVAVCLGSNGNSYYSVTDKVENTVMHSTDINIYWLIGVLTYNGLMNKNYAQPNAKQQIIDLQRQVIDKL
jgi:hypothetical protein